MVGGSYWKDYQWPQVNQGWQNQGWSANQRENWNTRNGENDALPMRGQWPSQQLKDKRDLNPKGKGRGRGVDRTHPAWTVKTEGHPPASTVDKGATPADSFGGAQACGGAASAHGQNLNWSCRRKSSWS